MAVELSVNTKRTQIEMKQVCKGFAKYRSSNLRDNNRPKMQNPPQWLNQSFYQNIPHAEVNWAQLAQRWMSMRPTPPPPQFRPPPPLLPRIPLNPPMPLLPTPSPYPIMPPDMDYRDLRPPPKYPAPNWEPARPGGQHWLPPRANHPPRASTTHDEPFDAYNYAGPGPDDANDFSYRFKESSSVVEYPHGEPCVVQYPEGDEQIPYAEGGAMTGDVSGSWPDAGMQWSAPLWNMSSGMYAGDFSTIDLHARKALPAWIREGLEKAEKEKRKKQEQEEKLKVAEQVAIERRAQRGLGKFDSSDEEEEEEENGRENGRKSSDDEEEESKEERSEEEIRQDAVSAVHSRTNPLQLTVLRRFMTEILLETTDRDVHLVCSRIYGQMSEKRARPEVVAKSSAALAALSQLGGDDDESESDDDSDKPGCNLPVFKTPLPPPLPMSGVVSSKSIQLSSNNLPHSQGQLNDNQRVVPEMVENTASASTLAKGEKESNEKKASSSSSTRGEDERKKKKKRRRSKTPEKYRRREDERRGGERRRSRSRSREKRKTRRSPSPDLRRRRRRSSSPKRGDRR